MTDMLSQAISDPLGFFGGISLCGAQECVNVDPAQTEDDMGFTTGSVHVRTPQGIVSKPRPGQGKFTYLPRVRSENAGRVFRRDESCRNTLPRTPSTPTGRGSIVPLADFIDSVKEQEVKLTTPRVLTDCTNNRSDISLSAEFFKDTSSLTAETGGPEARKLEYDPMLKRSRSLLSVTAESGGPVMRNMVSEMKRSSSATALKRMSSVTAETGGPVMRSMEIISAPPTA
eukprot:CAMPEP_0181328912 /NCGR_PEP_ID=MMETSP1101-20121128/23007_1 /TAXON_ID=46948 /ORGANISM="Rhodomonas abbreviata, Strain Caron Lab Isolate" /LENGTH=228 /DNA_ID=CAMNT_0023437909 /DNA_START=64 /DNA_END=750 /DNA_ORIENTATION=-